MNIFINQHDATFSIDNEHRPDDINDSKIAAWFTILFLFVCLALNAGTFGAYKCKYSKMSTNSTMQETDRAMESRLTIYAVWTFLSQLLMAILMIYIYMVVQLSEWQTPEENNNMFLAAYNHYYWISDCATIVVPSWLLLWASSKVRNVIRACIRKLCPCCSHLWKEPTTFQTPTTLLANPNHQAA